MITWGKFLNDGAISDVIEACVGASFDAVVQSCLKGAEALSGGVGKD